MVHPNAARLSNYEIARHCGVAETTVRNWRQELPSTQNAQIKRVTRNGTTYWQDTINIGKCKEKRTDEDAASELPQTPVSVSGDLWNLGRHKLLVGDSTDRSQVARLMTGEGTDLLFIDSPYNLGYEGRTEKRLTVRLPSVVLAARVLERAGGRGLRNPMPDHLGQEHVCVGLWALQVPARADLLLPRRRAEGSLVRRQIAIDGVAREEARG